MTAEEIITRLGLKPHPEGGHFVETFRAPESTAIYFLLKADERSHWHRVNADETWHHYAGAPLELSMSDDGHTVRHLRLGTDFGMRDPRWLSRFGDAPDEATEEPAAATT